MPIAEAWEVVVEREPEWSLDDRLLVMALPIYRAGIHHHGCGLHDSVYADPDHNVVSPASDTCPGCAALDRWRRILAEEEHERFKKAKAAEPRPSDGRVTYMKHTPLMPGETVDSIRDLGRR